MNNKFTTQSFFKAKENKEKITMLTAYDYSMAQLVDNSGIDAVLVGDSVGMVMQGHDSTLQVTMEDMIYHSQCVARGLKHALLVTDLPFLSYHVSIEEAVRNAGQLIQQGHAEAVKLEGGQNMAATVKAIVNAQIPVMGHIGLTPQSVNIFGGFKVQGKEEITAQNLINDALALEAAGAFSIVLEAVPEALAKLITEKLHIPTIGIGGGRYCDGQILVINDILGMYSDFTPKFVKKYANLNIDINTAVTTYISDVKNSEFPKPEHTFGIKDSVLDKLY
ncbi:3-methyl-2-oxobutanoate hydroxymethyltransferase [Pectinatus brassicae]|uniref:3-methyl-2-oxobutanoate hydroxymethyltransferase n=1 Tax=Pectinatus brassicae TaxID=862415 RepID=A0A840UE43_9FIRM|nr:3-methyl-2-oxobutanoate hydroxymethyltransferase [Pectinatus brassicae]MBB5335299.1 3-methyl-2-oxobutanoate hydroxymethyltransferase [Pectinatus brassicae]